MRLATQLYLSLYYRSEFNPWATLITPWRYGIPKQQALFELAPKTSQYFSIELRGYEAPKKVNMISFSVSYDNSLAASNGLVLPPVGSSHRVK